MDQLLCISVTLPDHVYHGRADGDVPEWPPSPFRLFQALLAGSRTGGRSRDWSDEKANAFRWLERRDAPLIIAPEVKLSTGYTHFVPNNDGDREFDRQDRLTGKRVKPQFLDGGATVHYLWPLGEGTSKSSRDAIDLLTRESRHLFALGWGIDVAFANGRLLSQEEVHQIEGTRWRPVFGDTAKADARRVPVAESLDDLESAHESFSKSIDGKLYRPPRKPSVFRKVRYLRESSLPVRPYALFEFPEEVAFRHEHAAIVAAMLRGAACAAAKSDTYEFPGGSEVYVAGHAQGRRETPERFSYLALPTIGHPHADGMIRRALIAEPYAGDGAHAKWAELRLWNTPLIDEDGNERTLLLEPWRNAPAVWNAYLRASILWSSVTPVILPGHDDRDPKRKAPALFLKAVEQAGIRRAAIEDFQLRRAPSWPGSLHPRQYRRPSYLKHLPAWHVLLRFKEPITGPLAIGAGRHGGLGIFASCEQGR